MDLDQVHVRVPTASNHGRLRQLAQAENLHIRQLRNDLSPPFQNVNQHRWKRETIRRETAESGCKQSVYLVTSFQVAKPNRIPSTNKTTEFHYLKPLSATQNLRYPLTPPSFHEEHHRKVTQRHEETGRSILDDPALNPSGSNRVRKG